MDQDITIRMAEARLSGRLNLSWLNLEHLPELPNNVTHLYCSYNSLVSVCLPPMLQYLDCSNNMLRELPTLPNTLITLICGVNQLTSLPILPESLRLVHCYMNRLTTLPELPNSLVHLSCYSNRLTSLPSLHNVRELLCDNNRLTNLPEIGESFAYLLCQENPFHIGLSNRVLNDNSCEEVRKYQQTIKTMRNAYKGLLAISRLPMSEDIVSFVGFYLTGIQAPIPTQKIKVKQQIYNTKHTVL
jgi:Leucine-rich repeat (LRR) protein